MVTGKTSIESQSMVTLSYLRRNVSSTTKVVFGHVSLYEVECCPIPFKEDLFDSSFRVLFWSYFLVLTVSDSPSYPCPSRWVGREPPKRLKSLVDDCTSETFYGSPTRKPIRVVVSEGSNGVFLYRSNSESQPSLESPGWSTSY